MGVGLGLGVFVVVFLITLVVGGWGCLVGGAFTLVVGGWLVMSCSFKFNLGFSFKIASIIREGRLLGLVARVGSG